MPVTSASINFVDLAGSERAQQAAVLDDADKERLRQKEVCLHTYSLACEYVLHRDIYVLNACTHQQTHANLVQQVQMCAFVPCRPATSTRAF